MKTRLAICLALAATASAVMPMPASAQALLPPYEVTTSVRSMGLEPISPPVRRGARYVLRAIDKRGTEVRVAADAFNGRVLFVRPVGYREGPVYADRVYPRIYPEEVPPPRGGFERPRNYQQQGSYEAPPDRPPARIPEPSVIYAPRDNGNPQNANPQSANPQPPARAPVAAKPPAPKIVAAKPAAKPPVPAETAAAPPAPAPEQPATTGSTPEPQAEKPSVAIPPVQGLE